MKQRTRKIISVILFVLFVLFSCLFISLRHNLLYESTLLDKEAIRLTGGLAALILAASLLLFRKLDLKRFKRFFIIYLILFSIAICLNEYLIYKKQNPEILLMARHSGFLNGRKLYLRDDKTYKVEESDLLNSKFSYGTYSITADSLSLNPCNMSRSFLHGEFVYTQGAGNNSITDDAHDFLMPVDEVEEAYDDPLLIETDKIFNK